MVKKAKLLLLAPVALLSISACGNKAQAVTFNHSDIVQKEFGGLGVEWGVYEDTDKIMDNGWEKIISHMDHLGAARVRVMVSYDWFCQNFDDKGNTDKNDDTWTYNFTNKYTANLLDILEYCQVNNIDVAFGAWNVIGTLGEDDVWHMMDEVTSDIRWAKVSSDVLDFLVNKRGFTCIKWFVSSNEPNWIGAKGSSKNYNNTYEKWEQGVKNVRAMLDDVGLQHIGIVGGDVTGFEGIMEYIPNIAKNIKNIVGDYGVHLYLSNISVDRGEMAEEITKVFDSVAEVDPRIGETIQANIWEGGLRDGKTILDCQSLIATTNYAVRMVDYTIQALASKINGICYWNFDDAMNFMYSQNSMTPKEWGMFSSLAEASSGKQELRPWYHTSSLLCHMFKKGNYVYSTKANGSAENPTFRSIATKSHDGTQGGFVAVNAGLKPVEKTFKLNESIKGDKLFVYVLNGDSYCLGSDGYIIPNYEIKGSLKDEITITIPNSTAVFVSNERL